MSDELRENATRLARWSECTSYQVVSLGTVHAVAKLADAYLADHPSDDDLRLTLEEAERAFGERLHIDATASICVGCVRVTLGENLMLATRGDLRHLLAILPPF